MFDKNKACHCFYFYESVCQNLLFMSHYVDQLLWNQEIFCNSWSFMSSVSIFRLAQTWSILSANRVWIRSTAVSLESFTSMTLISCAPRDSGGHFCFVVTVWNATQLIVCQCVPLLPGWFLQVTDDWLGLDGQWDKSSVNKRLLSLACVHKQICV